MLCPHLPAACFRGAKLLKNNDTANKMSAFFAQRDTFLFITLTKRLRELEPHVPMTHNGWLSPITAPKLHQPSAMKVILSAINYPITNIIK